MLASHLQAEIAPAKSPELSIWDPACFFSQGIMAEGSGSNPIHADIDKSRDAG